MAPGGAPSAVLARSSSPQQPPSAAASGGDVAAPPLFSAQRITKRFGAVKANDGIGLDAPRSTRCRARTAPAVRRW